MQHNRTAREGERELAAATVEDVQDAAESTAAHEQDEAAHLGVSLAELRRREAALKGGRR